MMFKTVFLILIYVCLLWMLPGPLGLIVAFLILTKHTQNFVLLPLAKYWGARGISPENYMERKLKNIREVIWFFAIILDIEAIFFLELLAIGISCKIINNFKNKLGIPTSVFSKDDYMVYDEYWKNNPPLVKDVFYGYEQDEYTENEGYGHDKELRDTKYNINVEEQVTIFGTKKEIEQEPKSEMNSAINQEQNYEVKTEIKQESNKENKYEAKKEETIKMAEEILKKEIEISEVELPKVDINLFDKPIEDIKTDFSIKTTAIETVNKFDFNKPVGDISTSTPDSSITTSKIEIKDDEITCEKCGTVMSKNKIACPKCGELVKYKPRR